MADGKTPAKVHGCSLQEGEAHRPPETVLLHFQGLDIHRESPGRYVARTSESRWTLPRSFKAPAIQLGRLTVRQVEWRVLTGILEAAWSILDVVSCGRGVHDIELVVRELPPESNGSIVITRPVEIMSKGSTSNTSSPRYWVYAPSREPIPMEHVPTESRISLHGIRVTRRQWMLYTAILEAAWLVAESMDDFLGD